jgi:RNA polymerase sigma factor (sigma-70 family)
LRVELLEDRSVPSVLSDEVSSVIGASLSAGVTVGPTGATVTLADGSVTTTGLRGPGLDRLITALSQLAQPSSELTTPPPVTVVLPPPGSFALECAYYCVALDAEPSVQPPMVEGEPPSGGTTAPGGSGNGSVQVLAANGGVPLLPASAQTVVLSGRTFSAADVVVEGSVPASAPQEGSGRVGEIVTPTSIFLEPVVLEARQPTTPSGAPSGPGALQVSQPTVPDSAGAPAVTGAAPPVAHGGSLSLAPGGTSATSPQTTLSLGAGTTTNPLTAQGTDGGISPHQFPDATGVGPTGGGSTEPRTPLADLSDGSLLQRFAANREQAAFTTLVRRHESSVLRVCTEVLGDPDRARDASQATFQALARRAGSLDGRGPLHGWLSTVAYHLALRCRAADLRRRQLERAAAVRVVDGEEVDPATDLEREELRLVIGEELDRLPAKYRVPLVLYYLGGRTHAEVAREVGLPRGSVARRIGDALGRLRDRLVARGFPF